MKGKRQRDIPDIYITAVLAPAVILIIAIVTDFTLPWVMALLRLFHHP
jgi:hypothetical protein